MRKEKLVGQVALKPQSRNRGFTLIEIMVVVAILGLLAVVVVPQVFRQLERAQTTKVGTDIRAIEGALKTYRIDNFRYPSQSEGLQALLVAPSNVRNWNGPYLDETSIPTDPWDSDYRYANPGTHGKEVEVFSFGADNAEGGDGADADIGSWNVK